MTTIIFIISYCAFVLLSTIFINPYLFLVWLITSYIFAFLVVVLFYFINLPIVLILKPTHPYKIYLLKSLAAFLIKCCLNMKVEIEGLENVPLDGRIVAYANHKSYTDAFALIQYFPRPVALTPKKNVLKIPLLRLWLKAYRAFPIDRENPKETLKDLDNAVDTVKSGLTILIYPEGTIKNRNEEEVQNAKAGAFRLVKNAEAELLPIRYDGNDLVRNRWPRRTYRKITIFKVIPYSKIKDLSTREIAQIFMDTINKKNLNI